MSSLTAELHTLPSSRTRSFVLPREHGAWGILLVPLATGGAVGLRHGAAVFALVLFAIAALALFCLRTPVEALLETSPFRAQTETERRAVVYGITGYAAIAGVALGALLWRERASGLLVLGGVVGAIFLAQATLKKFGRPTRMAAQLVGSLGLTSTAAGAYYVVTGDLGLSAMLLWFLNWLFAANQIHFVQVRILSARPMTLAKKFASGRAFLAGQVLTVMAAMLAWRYGSFPALALLAFVPVLARGFLWFLAPPAPLEIHRLGKSELAHALVFGALFILGFTVP